MGKARKRKPRYQRFTNREVSWLQFNARVQMEADNPDNPLLERAKFLAIVTSNLDEFMQVRYHGIREAAHLQNAGKKPLGGGSARNLYRRVNKEILHQQNLQYMLFEGIRSELYLQGVQLYPIFTLTEAMGKRETEIFKTEIKPNLRQLSKDEVLQQKQLHLMVKLFSPRRKETRFATLALPTALPRLYELTSEKGVHMLIRLEDIVRHHLPQLFPKEQVEQAATFRILRNQDFPLGEDRQAGLPGLVREMLRKRRTGQVMRLEAEERMPEEMLLMLMQRFGLQREQRYRVTGPLDLNKLMMNLYGQITRPDLKYMPAEPVLETQLMEEDVFARIARKDYLLYHPYHSFAPVAHLLQKAAKDPAVKAIKQTLYRVSSNSPIVEALAEAAEGGKRVVVVFEAQARFDEENNLFWGERLQKAGCQVIFGLPDLKTHSKITLIEREENGKIKRYLHLATGNYHDVTAKLYTDMGLITANVRLGLDAHRFFTQVEGGPALPMEALVKAPEALKQKLLSLIAREAAHAMAGRPAGILAKMNSLQDKDVIEALYGASQAGVPVRLIVRGICCLVPRLPGISENIRVRSIVGRHLEHARAFVFENGGAGEAYLSSADWMVRNLEKRVELMFPVKNPRLRRAVENVLWLQWRDTEKAWQKQPDGSYVRRSPDGGERMNAQEELLKNIRGVLGAKVVPETAQSAE